MIRTYSELITLPSFEERYKYLRLEGTVGLDTFGFDRVFNQMFYRSVEWKQFRHKVILRDTINGWCCDLGCEGHEIPDGVHVIIHHLNPITLDDIKNSNIEALLNLDNAICTTQSTHNAIHYGYEDSVVRKPINRKPFDTCPWR